MKNMNMSYMKYTQTFLYIYMYRVQQGNIVETIKLCGIAFCIEQLIDIWSCKQRSDY